MSGRVVRGPVVRGRIDVVSIWSEAGVPKGVLLLPFGTISMILVPWQEWPSPDECLSESNLDFRSFTVKLHYQSCYANTLGLQQRLLSFLTCS